MRGWGSASGDLSAWNAEDGWRSEYGGMADGLYFFAEDVFGGQFALTGDGAVVGFDPETGSSEPLAGSLDGWAAAVLADTDYLTGWSLAVQWQERHGPLVPGQRLVPIVPFVMAGKFVVENLYAMDDARSLCMRGSVAVQIRDLPDGANVRFRLE